MLAPGPQTSMEKYENRGDMKHKIIILQISKTGRKLVEPNFKVSSPHSMSQILDGELEQRIRFMCVILYISHSVRNRRRRAWYLFNISQDYLMFYCIYNPALTARWANSCRLLSQGLRTFGQINLLIYLIMYYFCANKWGIVY